MASFTIEWRSSTKKDLRGLPAHVVQRVIDAVADLGHEPFPNGSEKLAGAEHVYRVRIGDYRVIYEVLSENKIVEIQRVRHRKEVYR